MIAHRESVGLRCVACVVVKAAKQQALMAEIHGRLEMYRAGTPYREGKKTVDRGL